MAFSKHVNRLMEFSEFRRPYKPAAGKLFSVRIVQISFRRPYRPSTRDALISLRKTWVPLSIEAIMIHAKRRGTGAMFQYQVINDLKSTLPAYPFLAHSDAVSSLCCDNFPCRICDLVHRISKTVEGSASKLPLRWGRWSLHPSQY